MRFDHFPLPPLLPAAGWVGKTSAKIVLFPLFTFSLKKFAFPLSQHFCGDEGEKMDPHPCFLDTQYKYNIFENEDFVLEIQRNLAVAHANIEYLAYKFSEELKRLESTTHPPSLSYKKNSVVLRELI